MVKRGVLVLFAFFLIANIAYLHRVPGLFGDEASEGENVFQLLRVGGITVVGERSYVGPLVDYARVPFVFVAGYSALALRALMLLVSIVTFWLAYVVLRRLFGERAGLLAIAMMFFSPTYLLYQRLGWAITLFPFFGLLLIFFLTDKRIFLPYRSALAGLVAGLGLHNYVVFFPTLVGIGVPWLASFWRKPRELGKWWLAILGFWAGFGTQFAVLLLASEDQGSPLEVASLFWERARALPSLLPLVLSGSSYVARYTGVGFIGIVAGLVMLGLAVLVVMSLLMAPHRKMSVLWALGLGIQLITLLVMIDRFTLRYLVVFVLGVWVLAGVGSSVLLSRWRLPWAPVALAVGLLAWTGSTTLVPYLKTGGSTERFSLGNRTDAAADFVDIRPLVVCVREAGPVWSDNPHIHNRLLYLSRGDKRIDLPLDRNEAHWLVDYRLPGEPAGVVCPGLTHFRLTKRK